MRLVLLRGLRGVVMVATAGWQRGREQAGGQGTVGRGHRGQTRRRSERRGWVLCWLELCWCVFLQIL